MKRIALALVPALAAALLTTAVVAGATFAIGSRPLVAGDDPVTKCDPDGFTIDALTKNPGGQITSITIGGIHGDCVNGTLTVDLTTSANVSIGTGGPVTVTGSPMIVSIPGLPSATLVKHEVIIIVGP